MAKVIVLRPFVFSSPSQRPGGMLAHELRVSPGRDPSTGAYVPTEVDLPDDVAEHEWIAGQLADGCIEHPQKTFGRLEAVRLKREKEQEEATRITKQAEEALARAGRGHEVKVVRETDVDKELNTPVNVLRGQQGDDVDKAIVSPEPVVVPPPVPEPVVPPVVKGRKG